MLHNRSGHLIFLACLDSFACSFLACILQHREAELSMLQNSTARHKTSSAPKCWSQPIFSDVSVLLPLCSFSGLGRRKLIDCCSNFIKTRAIISSLIWLITACCEMCCSSLLYKGVYTFIDVSCYAVQHSVPSVKLSIGLSGR